MRKFMLFVVVLLAVVVGVILALGIYEPKDITITRTTLIKAQKDVVFEQIVKFKNWTNWSPWYRIDSGNMKMTYYGTDGQPGSGYTWDGSDKTGAGDMRDSALNGTQMTYHLTYTNPDRKDAWGDLIAVDTAGMTKVTWTCHIHFPFPFNAVLSRLDMDKMLGGDFESGLSNMKVYMESHAGTTVASSPAVEVKEVDYPGHIFEGVHNTVSMSDMMKFFDDARGEITTEAGTKINGVFAGIFYTWDTVGKNTDIMAGFPVSDSSVSIKGATFVYIPPSKAVMAVQRGGYERSMDTHNAIKKYMAAKGLVQSCVIEEYITDKTSESDNNKWVTNVYYLVK